MNACILALQLAAVAAAVTGAVISDRGARRAREGAALARAVSSLESQLTRPPREVLAESARGRAAAASGLRLARRGLWIATGGCVAAIVSTVWQILS